MIMQFSGLQGTFHSLFNHRLAPSSFPFALAVSGIKSVQCVCVSVHLHSLLLALKDCHLWLTCLVQACFGKTVGHDRVFVYMVAVPLVCQCLGALSLTSTISFSDEGITWKDYCESMSQGDQSALLVFSRFIPFRCALVTHHRVECLKCPEVVRGEDIVHILHRQLSNNFFLFW